MEVFRLVVSVLVLGIGLFGWMICIPQFRLLLKTKNSSSNSLFTSLGSFTFQSVFCINALMVGDWCLAIAATTSLVNASVMITLISYFRRFPGGRNQEKKSAAGMVPEVSHSRRRHTHRKREMRRTLYRMRTFPPKRQGMMLTR